uniref:Uncharacterized protein n=1 Tax=Romanomermis culicivorax TaxID=13658 RepID=A0A915J7E6_ROMCU
MDAVRRAVEEASRNARPTAVVAASRSTRTTGAQPTAVVAASPSTRTTGAQTQAAIAQQQPVANAFAEMLRAVNDDVSIIEASPFPMATVPQSLKIGVLCDVHPCGGLVIDFPREDPVLSDDDDKE